MPEQSCRNRWRRLAMERFIMRGAMAIAAMNLCVGNASIAIADEIHVCRRPPNVPQNWGRWSYTSGGKIMFETADNKIFQQKTNGLTVYVYDPWASVGSMKALPMPHNKLPCPPPPPRPAQVSPSAAPPKAASPPATAPPAKPAAPPVKPAPKKEAPKLVGNGKGDSGADDVAPDKAPDNPKPIPGPGIKKMPIAWAKPIPKDPPPNALPPGTALLPNAEHLPPAETLPQSTALLPKSDQVGAGITSKGSGPGNKLEDKDPSRGGGAGTAGTAPVTGFDRVAYELAFAAAIVNGQMNEDLTLPGSTAHGIVGGKNPGGPDMAVVQAAVSLTQISSAAIITQANKFAQRLKQAFATKNERIILNGVDDVTEEVAEALAKQYGVDIAEALAKNGTIGPYAVMKKFTEKLGGAYQAHHIFENARIKKLLPGANPDKFPAIILTKEEHQAITRELAKRSPEMTNLKKAWKVYQEVYKDYPAWLEAIRPYFP